MKIHQVIGMVTLSLVASTALAAPDTTQPSRSQVKQEAIDARKAGQTHVGDDPLYPDSPAKSSARAGKRKAKRAHATPAPAVAPDQK